MKQLDLTDAADDNKTGAPRKSRAPKRRNRAPGSRENLQRLNLEVPRDLHKRLKLKAIYEDRTVTDIVLQAINEYLHAH